MSLTPPRIPPEYVRPIQIVGGVLFFIAFSLDAVILLPGSPFGEGGPQSGFMCAIFSLMMLPGALLRFFQPHAGVPLTGSQIVGPLLTSLSGLTNILVPCYIVGTRRWRLILSIVIALCLAVTLPGIHLSKMRPLYGCFIWMTGIILILTGQLSETSQNAAEGPERTAVFQGLGLH